MNAQSHRNEKMQRKPTVGRTQRKRAKQKLQRMPRRILIRTIAKSLTTANKSMIARVAWIASKAKKAMNANNSKDAKNRKYQRMPRKQRLQTRQRRQKRQKKYFKENNNAR